MWGSRRWDLTRRTTTSSARTNKVPPSADEMGGHADRAAVAELSACTPEIDKSRYYPYGYISSSLALLSTAEVLDVHWRPMNSTALTKESLQTPSSWSLIRESLSRPYPVTAPMVLQLSI